MVMDSSNSATHPVPGARRMAGYWVTPVTFADLSPGDVVLISRESQPRVVRASTIENGRSSIEFDGSTGVLFDNIKVYRSHGPC